MSFIEGIKNLVGTTFDAVASPFEALAPDESNTDPDENNVFELTATILESCGAIPFRLFNTTGEFLDEATGDGVVNGLVMATYMLNSVPCGYVAVLPWWLAGAAVRGIGEKIDG